MVAGGLASSGGLAAKSKLDDQKLQFEAQIQTDSGNDPLDSWIRYIKWTQAAFPSSSTELLPVLERCTRECRVHERYKQVWSLEVPSLLPS